MIAGGDVSATRRDQAHLGVQAARWIAMNESGSTERK